MIRATGTRSSASAALLALTLLARAAAAVAAGTPAETAPAPVAASAAVAPAPAAGTLTVRVREAVFMGLENNRALRVERLQPEVVRTGETAAVAPFDTQLGASYQGQWGSVPKDKDGETDFETGNIQRGSLEASRYLPTGTTLAGEYATGPGSGSYDSTTRLGLTVTQALLQGRGTEVNLAAVREARIDTALSSEQLRGFAESLVAQVEQACWDYELAVRRIGIVERSLRLGEEQLAEVRERVAVGRLAEIEVFAAEAEVAVRRETLINARGARDLARLQLLRLLNPPGENPLAREVAIGDAPALPPAEPDPVEAHVALGLKMRPDLAEARLRLQRGDLELVRTRNGLLPQLDIYVTAGKSGYADRILDTADLSGEGYDVQAGLVLRYPWQNSAARADHRRAIVSRAQAEESVANLAQLVEVDVRGAWIELARLREQAAATAATRQLQEEKLRAETEKFRVGKSTAFLVAQAQRDLLQAENETVTAFAGCIKASIELYRLEGSLLARRGIQVPGPPRF